MPSDSIPINMARIEWGDGGFRISHYRDEPSDRNLPDSGGACFGSWMNCKDTKTLVAWCYWHGLMAIQDGATWQNVFRELDKVAECRTFHNTIACDPINWSIGRYEEDQA